MMHISHLEKKAAQEIIAAFVHKIEKNSSVAAITWSELGSTLSKPAQRLVRKICSLDPGNYGIKRKPVTPIEKDNLSAIEGQVFHTVDYSKNLPTRLLPEDTHDAFKKMNKKLKYDIGEKLIVKSGYRSPAYQLYIFLYNLKINDWDIQETLKTVALPGYSEHAGSPQAVDVRTKHHIGPEHTYDFARTAEYRWLQNNAAIFGFRLSYPKNNELGAEFEPWHWQHVGD